MLTKATIAFLRYAAGRQSKRELRPTEIGSVAVVELARLGDVVSMLPAVTHLKSFFPNASVRLFVDDRYAPLVNALDIGANAIGLTNTDSISGLAKSVPTVREYKPDIACSISPAKRNAFVTLACGAQFKVGYLTYIDTLTPYLQTTAVESWGFELRTRVSYSMENITERSLHVCRALGIPVVRETSPIRFHTHIQSTVTNKFEQRRVIPSRPYVVIHPFSGWEYRNWSLANFKALANQIVNELEYDVVFVCTLEESDRLTMIKNEPGIHVFASNDLVESAVVIKNASLFIGNDSGPLHLAATLGVQCIGLYGPASPKLTAPNSKNSNWHFVQVDCSPCEQRVCIRPENPCMGLVEPQQVFVSVAGMLGVGQRSAAHA
ncbi:MAG: glycosyltransferase family 9 protein [Bacteroidota bacterium]